MAYVPDEMVMKFREVSPTARVIAHYLCLCANQGTGKCFPSQELISQELGLRLDHIKTYEAELVKKGWIIVESNKDTGRVVTIIKGWISRNDRSKKKSATNLPVTSGNSPNPGNAPQVTGGDHQDSGDSPKLGSQPPQNLGSDSQNLGESPQNLGSYIRSNQPNNQPNEPAKESTPSASPSEQGKKNESNGRKDRTPNPYHRIFIEAFQSASGVPYVSNKGDFVQLAAIRRAYSLANWDLSEDRFRQAVSNYFASELGTRTLADLCTRFSTFYTSALDRFGRAIKENGTGGPNGNHKTHAIPGGNRGGNDGESQFRAKRQI